MKNNFADRLQERIDEMGNPTCLGLDPMLSYLPESLLQKYDCRQEEGIYLALSSFCSELIMAVADIVPAIKPQMAYFEQYGLGGLRALQSIIALAKAQGMLVILDGKRNDIGSTAAAYSRAYLSTSGPNDHELNTSQASVAEQGSKKSNNAEHENCRPNNPVQYAQDQTSRKTDNSGRYSQEQAKTFLAADALTVNGYLGSDGIKPFLELCQANDKGIFVLCRTSNPSAGDLQDLELTDGRLVYEAMADLIASWGQDLIGSSGISSVGAVVGATWPAQAAALRRRMPHTFFLIPGFGAQGGTAADAVAGFDRNGRAGIVNASRSLMLAWKKHGPDHAAFASACRQEAIAMRDSLRTALSAHRKTKGF